MGRRRLVGEKIFTAPNQGGEEQEEETEDVKFVVLGTFSEHREVASSAGKSKWEKPLADWITATGVGLVGQDRVDKEDERVERNDRWRREPFL
jgi:hypothetical protein